MLQAATVPVVSDWECFEMTGLLNYEDQVCAGGVGAEASACPGDSGGALQVGQLITNTGWSICKLTGWG